MGSIARDIVAKWGEKLSDLGVKTIALSDTIGVSNLITLSLYFPHREYPQMSGAHTCILT